VDERLKIANQTMMETFLNRVEGLHDSILRAAILQNTGHVDGDGWMHGDDNLPDMQLYFQSQSSSVIGVELLLEGVSWLNLRFPRGFDEADGEVLSDGTVLYPYGKDAGSKSEIRCRSVSYRMLGMESRGSHGAFGTI
jgi:hypothetical protein